MSRGPGAGLSGYDDRSPSEGTAHDDEPAHPGQFGTIVDHRRKLTAMRLSERASASFEYRT